MTGKRSIIVSLASALLLVFIATVFVPAFSNNVFATEDTYIISSDRELRSALAENAKKIKIADGLRTVSFAGTFFFNSGCEFDLNSATINLSDSGHFNIVVPDDETVVFEGSGLIKGYFEDTYIIDVRKGNLLVRTSITNSADNGSIFNESDNIEIQYGSFTSENPIDPSIISEYSTSSVNGNTTLVAPALTIANIFVNSENSDDILGNGVFSYDVTTKTLNVSGDYSYDEAQKTDYLIISSDDITLYIVDDSNLVGSILIMKDLTITGPGKLNLRVVDNPGIWMISGTTLTYKDASVEFSGPYGMMGLNGKNDNHLVIDHSEITAHNDCAFIRTGAFDSIDFIGCGIIEPSVFTIINGEIYDDESELMKDIVIAPSWSDAEYTWSSDYSTCTAKKVCKYESTHIVTETVSSTSVVKIAATESEKGTTTYTAKFENKAFETQTKDVQDIPVIKKNDPVNNNDDPINNTEEPVKNNDVPVNNTNDPTFEDFVERLYVVALNRASEPEGKAFWCEHVGNGDLNGAQCANEFLLSKEFNDRGLSDEEFLKVLYKTFFDRDAAADPDGFNFWMNSLKTEGRDKVVDGFINSEEWCNICATYGVKSGATRAKATIPSKNAKEFAERLYTKCLGRDAEEEGLMFWALGLTNLELTGKQAAHEFFFSKEFNDHNFDNKDLLTRMYRTFMGREPDDDGMNFWLDSMKNGMTKEQVFDEFVKSAEFTGICKDYAIDRG
ncbi:MAG: DUF4214 domain-containing protein [Clostridia bacterium]|nr:DUF4214 domain-containing protein [Clostridia bacterium]